MNQSIYIDNIDFEDAYKQFHRAFIDAWFRHDGTDKDHLLFAAWCMV